MLDELAFEDEGFLFVFDGVEFEVANAIDEGSCFDIRAHFSGRCEVASNTFFEVFGFADIDDAAEAIFHQVNARFVWGLLKLVF